MIRARYLRIDLGILDDPRYLEFETYFSSPNLAIGAWFRAASLIGTNHRKRVPMGLWRKYDLPVELLKDLFVEKEGYVHFVTPSYTGTEGVKPNLQMEPQDLVEIWNENCGRLPKALGLQGSRLQKAKQRLNECDDKEIWKKVVVWISKSEWHTGRNDRGWKATIDFLLRPNTRIGVLERLEKEVQKASIIEW